MYAHTTLDNPDSGVSWSGMYNAFRQEDMYGSSVVGKVQFNEVSQSDVTFIILQHLMHSSVVFL